MNAVRPAAVAGMFYPGDARPRCRSRRSARQRGANRAAPGLSQGACRSARRLYLFRRCRGARLRRACGGARQRAPRSPARPDAPRCGARLAVPPSAATATPLGQVRIDREAIASVRDLPQVVVSDAAHALEHSLEVQLPFLQKMLGDFALAPFAVGTAGVQEVAEVLERACGRPGNADRDLHRHVALPCVRAGAPSTAPRLRGSRASRPTSVTRRPAARRALNGLLSFSRQKNLALKLLPPATPAIPPAARTGWSAFSFALYEGGEVSLAEAGKAASIARAAPKAVGRKRNEKPEASWLAQPAPRSSA